MSYHRFFNQRCTDPVAAVAAIKNVATRAAQRYKQFYILDYNLIDDELADARAARVELEIVNPGISGIVGRMLGGHQVAANAAFVAGLVSGPFIYAALTGGFPAVTIAAPWPVVIAAGLLVGFGTRMGSGCTSGHGILGLARFSKRSLAATLAFLAAGIITATAMGAFR